MITIKKLFSLTTIFFVSHALSETITEDYTSGKAKIEHIMTNDETGIGAYNKKNIHYAETKNLTTDLNIPQIAEFFECKTLMGKSFMTEVLKIPVLEQDKKTVLAQRQNAIKTLVNDPTLKKEVDELLETARKAEQEVISLMSDFFKGKTCPELKMLEAVKSQSPHILPLYEFLILNPTGKAVGWGINLTSLIGVTLATSYLTKITYDLAKIGQFSPSLTFYTAYIAVINGLIAYANYKDYSHAIEKRSKLHALNELISIAENIESLCKDVGIKNQFNISDIQNAEGTALIKNLKHPRYSEENTYAFFVPAVHSFLYRVFQQEKHLAEIFACIAEIDAYNAIATKMLEASSQTNKFCFVRFASLEKPYIHTQGFWNVLVKNAVANDLTEDKNIILTGPNAGGKTTAIRAILQNIVLGQTFGIAAAETFEFTPFDIIHSYLNVSDDLINGLSLFKAEVKRAQEILQQIKQLASPQKLFFALDELFTGTVAEDGETCAYEFVKRIASFEGIQFVYATHFEKLKQLGAENDFCINYKVNAPIKDSNGKLVYPFTLAQGANEARVALDIAKEAELFV